MSWPLAFTLIALLIVAVVVDHLLRLESWPARARHGKAPPNSNGLGKDLRAAFIDIAHLQPRITDQQPRLHGTNHAGKRAGRPVTDGIEVEHELAPYLGRAARSA